MVEQDVFSVYTTSGLSAELRQSEVITDLSQYVYDPSTGSVQEIVHPYVIILSQDCDLLREFEERDGLSSQNGVLIYELKPFSEAKAAGPPGRDIWKRIENNNDERFHFFEQVPSNADLLNIGIPELVADFRRHFTISAKEILRQCGDEGPGLAKRRCRLEMPYRENLQVRAAFYFQRVVLPSPHRTIGT